ncbi:hypothetical protein [Jeotgalibaca porci]|uniref:hypothetical protein n=1 Tax=Jeotgalibaca porci TaxID=1868793 RepID=UPI00359F4D3C
MTNVICEPRMRGKTTRMIVESHKKQIPIVVSNATQVKIIIEKAKEMGKEIPKPISAFDLLRNRERYNLIHGVLIDEASAVLSIVLGARIEGMTVTKED